MKKKDIVKDNRYFNQIIKEGKSLKNEHYIIYIMKSNLENPKFGFAVGKKIGNAVTRNKVKRRIKNIVTANIQSFTAYNDYIIIAKKSCKDEKYDKLLTSMEKLLEKKVN